MFMVVNNAAHVLLLLLKDLQTTSVAHCMRD